MSEIQKQLRDQEKVIYQAQKHNNVLVLPLLFMLIFLLTLIGLRSAEGDVSLLALSGLGLASLTLALISGAVRWLHREFAVFVITNQRLFIRDGWIGQPTHDISLSLISKVEALSSLSIVKFGYGRLKISAPGLGDPATYRFIRKPEIFRDRLQQAIAAQKVH